MAAQGYAGHARELEELVEEMTEGLKESKKAEEEDKLGVLRIEEFEVLNEVLMVMHSIGSSEILMSEVVERQLMLDIQQYRNDCDKIPRAAQKLVDSQRALSAIRFRIEALRNLQDRKFSQQMTKLLPGCCAGLTQR